MKVLFVYPNIAKTLQIPMGIAYISSYLKYNNIETFLWDHTFETEPNLILKVKEISPDFVCFGALSPDYLYAKKLATMIRKITKAPIIIGGHHATHLPHEVINEDCFDVVVRGEGEYSLYDYITTLNNKTKGVWVKDGNIIYTNPVGEIPNVDLLPWPDHEMFKKHLIKEPAWKDKRKGETIGVFLTARGCPFKCSYCSCDALRNLYADQKITRHRSIADVIEEVRAMSDRYKINSIWFTDETLVINKKRVLEFCKIYKDEIGIPFAIETRPDTVDEEVLSTMKDAGCTLIRMGIESGSDRVRNEIHNRNISRKTIISAFKTAKKIGLKTSSFNICGAPTETVDDIRETIKLNQECKVDDGKMTIFNVFPGSKMWDYCKQNGYYIRENYPENYYVDSNIRHETLTIEELLDLRKEFKDAIK